MFTVREISVFSEHKLQLQNFLSSGNVSKCSCPLWGCACPRTACTYLQGSLHFSLYRNHGLGTWVRTDNTGTQQEISLLSQRVPHHCGYGQVNLIFWGHQSLFICEMDFFLYKISVFQPFFPLLSELSKKRLLIIIFKVLAFFFATVYIQGNFSCKDGHDKEQRW